MQYTKPQITNVAKAHKLVQGSSDKSNPQAPDNNIVLPNCTSPAYEADE